MELPLASSSGRPESVQDVMSDNGIVKNNDWENEEEWLLKSPQSDMNGSKSFTGPVAVRPLPKVTVPRLKLQGQPAWNTSTRSARYPVTVTARGSLTSSRTSKTEMSDTGSFSTTPGSLSLKSARGEDLIQSSRQGTQPSLLPLNKATKREDTTTPRLGQSIKTSNMSSSQIITELSRTPSTSSACSLGVSDVETSLGTVDGGRMSRIPRLRTE